MKTKSDDGVDDDDGDRRLAFPYFLEVATLVLRNGENAERCAVAHLFGS